MTDNENQSSQPSEFSGAAVSAELQAAQFEATKQRLIGIWDKWQEVKHKPELAALFDRKNTSRF